MASEDRAPVRRDFDLFKELDPGALQKKFLDALLTIQNVRRQVNRVEKTIKMISEGIINPEPMITHTFPFEDTKMAFDMVSSYSDGVLKAMIDFH